MWFHIVFAALFNQACAEWKETHDAMYSWFLTRIEPSAIPDCSNAGECRTCKIHPYICLLPRLQSETTHRESFMIASACNAFAPQISTGISLHSRHACSSSNRLTWSFSSSITCKISRNYSRNKHGWCKCDKTCKTQETQGETEHVLSCFIYVRRIDLDRSAFACLFGHRTHEHDNTTAVYTNLHILPQSSQLSRNPELNNWCTRSSPYPVYRDPTFCCSSKCLNG